LPRRLLTSVRKALFATPELQHAIWSTYYGLSDRKLSWKLDEIPDRTTDVFTDIYDRNLWGSTESASGFGSTEAFTIGIRAALPGLLARYEVRTFLDAPCGDFHWMRHVELPEGVDYIGADIVPSIVERNNGRYGDARRRFIRLDLVEDELPAADFWMCRDCFIHFPDAAILAILEKFRRSDIAYLMTTSHDFAPRNEDIAFGDFRLLNLRKPPFSLPPPIDYIYDYTPTTAPRRMSIWSREQLRGWRPAG
jgi:hypothetical protein